MKEVLETIKLWADHQKVLYKKSVEGGDLVVPTCRNKKRSSWVVCVKLRPQRINYIELRIATYL